MEGWRQERLGSRAGTHREEEKNKNILTRKEKRKKNILDTHRHSHGRTLLESTSRLLVPISLDINGKVLRHEAANLFILTLI
jgi:hypothetical protein